MFDFELDSVDPQQVDVFQKTGGILPIGKYHVRVDGHRDVVSNGGTCGEELHFIVIGGPHAGAEIKETLWKTDKDGSKNRLILFASRLGLIKREGAKFVPVPGKTGFCDAIGSECVIEVTHEEYDKKSGGKGKAVRVSFQGIWRLDDPEAKSVKRGKSTDVKAKPKVEASDL